MAVNIVVDGMTNSADPYLTASLRAVRSETLHCLTGPTCPKLTKITTFGNRKATFFLSRKCLIYISEQEKQRAYLT